MRIVTLILIILCIHFTAQAQMTPNAVSQNSFLSNDISNPIDEYFIQHPDKQFHSSLKPFNYVTLNKLNDDKINYKHVGIHNYLMTIHTADSSKSKNQLRFQILPQVNVEQGKDLLTNKWTNSTSGGLYLKLEGNKKFTAAATYIGGYITAPNFNDTTIQEYGIVPGMGIAYPKNLVKDGIVPPNYSQLTYSYQNFSGYVSYSPRNFINLQVGKDKHFVGDGYRSLLLSDVANNYPYFKTSFNIWRLQYSVWYSWFNNIQDASGMKKDFKNKYGTFHYLSWNATKNLNFSIFENVIFQGTDTTRSRGFDPNYLNPVIFYRPVEYSLGSSDNSMLGFNFKATIAKSVKLYGQVVLDEFYLKEIRAKNGWWANKQGFQLGAKYINAFGIKKLTLQTEYNLVRPYTYSHGSPDQSYSHFNQPLAHPFGANFKEAIGIVSYKHYRYRLEGKFIYAEMGRDSLNNSNVGQNLFLSYTTRPKEYGHYTGQGVSTTFMQAEIKYTYYLIADWNLRIEAGLIQRIYQNERGFDKQTPFIYAGIKTNLYNSYRDF